MNGLDALAIAELPKLAFAVVLLVGRIGAALMLLPGFGEAELPMTVRAALAVAFVALLGPLVAPLLPAPPTDIIRTAAMVIAEVLTGLWFGWLARLLVLALPAAGQIIASLTGLANILQPDPALGPQTAALSRLLGLAAPVAIFAAGLDRLPLEALIGTYRLIPPGTILPAGDTAETIVRGVSDSFALAMRLAGPFILAGIIWHVALAVLARLVPHLQVFFLSTPGQVLGGLVLLALLSAALIAIWQEHVATGLAGLPGL